MELETVNRLYLELSQFATAKTARELELEDLLISAHAIADRKGKDTAWERFSLRLSVAGIGHITAKTFRALDGDPEWINRNVNQFDGTNGNGYQPIGETNPNARPPRDE